MMLAMHAFLCESAHKFLVQWRSTDLGRLFGTIPYAFNRPTLIVFGTLSAASMPEITDAMSAYATELTIRSLPYMVEGLATIAATQGQQAAASIGPGLLEMSLHARTHHDDEAWHSASFRDAMTNVVATARGVAPTEADPMGLIQRLWADLNSLDPPTDA